MSDSSPLYALVKLRRVTTETTVVTVTAEQVAEAGHGHVGDDAFLHAALERIADEPPPQWQLEGPPQLSLHPDQKRPIRWTEAHKRQ